jgi:hypothetical protein
MGRYKDKYDESLNPFEKFKGRVRPLFLIPYHRRSFIFVISRKDCRADPAFDSPSCSSRFVHPVLFLKLVGGRTSRPSSQPNRTSCLCSLSSNHWEQTGEVHLCRAFLSSHLPFSSQDYQSLILDGLCVCGCGIAVRRVVTWAGACQHMEHALWRDGRRRRDQRTDQAVLILCVVWTGEGCDLDDLFTTLACDPEPEERKKNLNGLTPKSREKPLLLSSL